MRSGAERIRSQLVSFNHVTDPHFVTLSSSLYTTICNPNPNTNRNRYPNLNPNPYHNPNRNATVITDSQIVPILIHKLSPF